MWAGGGTKCVGEGEVEQSVWEGGGGTKCVWGEGGGGKSVRGGRGRWNRVCVGGGGGGTKCVWGGGGEEAEQSVCVRVCGRGGGAKWM